MTGAVPGPASPSGADRPAADPLAAVWPLFGLVLRTPRLVLTPLRDEHLPGLVDAALAGIHDPAVMPFSVPWTDAPRDVLVRETLKYQWRLRAETGPDEWAVPFAVLRDRRVIGVQDLTARRFRTLRQVGTGSWLTGSAQGQGVGTEMRAAVLQFAFDRLGATSAVSAAAEWNRASLGVSRRLGYVPNGTALVETRAGESGREQRFLLQRDQFLRPSWSASIAGDEAAVAFLLGGSGEVRDHRRDARGPGELPGQISGRIEQSRVQSE